MANRKDEIWKTLKTIPYPGYNRDIVSFGLVQRVAACDGVATVDLDLAQVQPEAQQALVASIRSVLAPLPELETLQVQAGKPVDIKPRLMRGEREPASRPPGVRRVVAVGSGKALGMFRRLKVPILGVVENLSYFVCDECEARHYLFGRGGGQRLAEAEDVPFLGEVPLEPAVRAAGDSGLPVVLRSDSAAGAAFGALAGHLQRELALSEEKVRAG